jgi:hypothetical protein
VTRLPLVTPAILQTIRPAALFRKTSLFPMSQRTRSRPLSLTSLLVLVLVLALPPVLPLVPMLPVSSHSLTTPCTSPSNPTD